MECISAQFTSGKTGRAFIHGSCLPLIKSSLTFADGDSLFCLPGGLPGAPHEASTEEPGQEALSGCTCVSWLDSSWNWLPLQWQEYEVNLR